LGIVATAVVDPQAFVGRAGSDAVGVVDAGSRAARALTGRAGSDALAAADAGSRAGQPFARATGDALAPADGAVQAASKPRAGADSLGAADGAARAVARTRGAQDAVSEADASVQARALPRAGADSVGAADAGSRSGVVSARPGQDAVGVADAGVGAPRALSRAGSDALGDADAGTGSFVVVRAAGDALAAADAGSRSGLVTARQAQDSVVIAERAPRGYPAVIVSHLPTAYFRLDDGDSTARDYFAMRDGAYVGGPAHTSGPLGSGQATGAVTLDGSSQYVTAPDLGIAENPSGVGFSYEVWFRTSAGSGLTNLWMVNEASTATNNTLAGLSVESGKLRAFLRDDANVAMATTSAAFVNDGKWHLAGLTWTPGAPSGLRVLLDGAQVGVTSATIGARSTDRTTVGALVRSALASGSVFPGDLAEAAFYPYVLTTARHLLHFQARGRSRLRLRRRTRWVSRMPRSWSAGRCRGRQRML
jgi:hypothetical protein